MGSEGSLVGSAPGRRVALVGDREGRAGARLLEEEARPADKGAADVDACVPHEMGIESDVAATVTPAVERLVENTTARGRITRADHADNCPVAVALEQAHSHPVGTWWSVGVDVRAGDNPGEKDLSLIVDVVPK